MPVGNFSSAQIGFWIVFSFAGIFSSIGSFTYLFFRASFSWCSRVFSGLC